MKVTVRELAAMLKKDTNSVRIALKKANVQPIPEETQAAASKDGRGRPAMLYILDDAKAVFA
jgi:predicted ArsR family transcriptional regulator